MDESLAVKLAEVDARSRENVRRIDNLEKSNEALNRLASSVEVMAMEQKHQTESIIEVKVDVANLGAKVETIESKPGKRWESIVDKCIWAVVGGLIAFMLVQIGIS